MDKLIRKLVLEKYNSTLNTPKDCDLLSERIYICTNRKISSTTLRRFFGLLPSNSNISKYNLDTLAIFCGDRDYNDFIESNSNNRNDTVKTNEKTLNEITQYTLNSIAQKTLGEFEQTIPREDFNLQLNNFLKSSFSIFPIIAPGGYGKSIALAHWIKKIDPITHECLFCSASIFYQLISANSNVSIKLNLQLDNPDNYFGQSIKKKKQLVCIIDSMDEVISNAKKYKEIINYFVKIIGRYQNSLSIKIIFSIRESSWNNLMKQDIAELQAKKSLDNIFYSIDSGFSNLPTLSISEVKRIIRLNSNDFSQVLQFDAIPHLLKDIIRVPINLYYLFALLKKDHKTGVFNANNLNRKYLKEFVFTSKHAESKEDLLWKTIELIENSRDNYVFNKNQLKKHFPIHLKRETEFYFAYKELIINGILYEERVENNYGIYTTLIGYKHQNFYFYLSALNQIQENNCFDHSLLLKVCNSDKSLDWKCNIISILYEIAYEDEQFNTLEKFCELPPEIISSLTVRFSVGNSFRINNTIRDKLIQKYASCQAGQIYFFEQFVDTNFIFNNFEYRIVEYLKNKKGNEAQLFGNSLLLLAGFLKMDSLACKKQFEIINSIEPDSTIHPWPIGRKAAYQILHHYFVEKKKIQNVFGYIEHYLNIAYKNSDYLNNGLVEFELAIFIALVLTKEYKTIIKLYEKLTTSYKIEIPEELGYLNKYNQNILPYLFSEFAKNKLGLKVSNNYIQILEKTIDSFPSTFDDFQYKIILKYFLSDWYKNIDIEKANEYYQLAMKLSEFAQYDFYKAFLLINNPTKDEEKLRNGHEMIKNSGFEIEYFLH
jgi:hypothetical protein